MPDANGNLTEQEVHQLTDQHYAGVAKHIQENYGTEVNKAVLDEVGRTGGLSQHEVVHALTTEKPEQTAERMINDRLWKNTRGMNDPYNRADGNGNAIKPEDRDADANWFKARTALKKKRWEERQGKR
jgi:hypothetical protein